MKIPKELAIELMQATQNGAVLRTLKIFSDMKNGSKKTVFSGIASQYLVAGSQEPEGFASDAF